MTLIGAARCTDNASGADAQRNQDADFDSSIMLVHRGNVRGAVSRGERLGLPVRERNGVEPCWRLCQIWTSRDRGETGGLPRPGENRRSPRKAAQLRLYTGFPQLVLICRGVRPACGATSDCQCGSCVTNTKGPRTRLAPSFGGLLVRGRRSSPASKPVQTKKDSNG